jgi:beta-glucosidase
MESIRNALADGTLSREDLKACVRRMLTVIFQTNAYEDAVSYGAQFN